MQALPTLKGTNGTPVASLHMPVACLDSRDSEALEAVEKKRTILGRF